MTHGFIHDETRPAQRPVGQARGVSLLETSIAVAILGVGMIMVAAIFPASLNQHRMSSDQAASMELLTKAQAMLRGGVDMSSLYIPPQAAPSAVPQDSPWYLLPTINLNQGGSGWNAMVQGTATQYNTYANLLNGFGYDGSGYPLGNFPDYLPRTASYPDYPKFPAFYPAQRGFLWMDLISDREMTAFVPTDADLQAAPNRFVWYGFYRRLASGSYRYAVAICKQRRNQVFAEQDCGAMGVSLSSPSPYNVPRPLGISRRLPVPWRASAGYFGGKVLSNVITPQMLGNGIGLGIRAPRGAKLMIQGSTFTNTNLPVYVPTGRILTVTNVINTTTVEVAEDVTDLPTLTPAGVGTIFDVWVFPPAVDGTEFIGESPVVLWRTNL